MAAPHPVNASKGSSSSSGKSSVGSLFDFLNSLFTQSPPWVRTILVLGVFTATGLGIYKWLASQSGVSKQTADGQPAYSLGKGQQIAPPGNANDANKGATERISEDDGHYKWHATHEKHEPDWNIISMADEDNLLEYKYYKDTDRCILLWRKENGEGTPQWIRDTVFLGRSGAQHSELKKPERSLADLLIEPAFASPRESPLTAADHLHSVQMGCANPHPGQFQWWWGPASDQCWSPMYRRFGDGCTHHQMFNRCYNTWDPNIWWDYCTGAPQHW